MHTSYTVLGMTCDHCVASVSAALTALPTVDEVTVDLTSGGVTITSSEPVSTDDVARVVREAGYSLAG